MTKKDYDLIASCIGASQAEEYSKRGVITINDLTVRLMLELELDNPRFNKTKFYDRVEYWRKQHGGE